MSAAIPQVNEFEFTGIIYGPVASRRWGQSLGIDLLGAEKICSFDCRYCHLGATTVRLNRLKNDSPLPTVADVLSAATRAFTHIHEFGPGIDTICISGNGEPTLHPEFPEIVKGLLALRDTWLPGRPLIVLTNGANLGSRKIIQAMNLLDERVVKIDAGNEKVFKLINAPLARVTLAQVINGSRNLRDIIIQSLFVQGEADNTKSSDVDDWIEVVAMLKPKAVHIHGMNRPPPYAGLVAVDEDGLHSISARLERRMGLRAQVTL